MLIVVSGSDNSGGDAENVQQAGTVDRLLDGIPQHGLVLGDPQAKVALVEFGDLQCPVCKGFSEEFIPPVIESKVRSGEATIEFRNYTIIGEESIPAGAAAIAAGEQGRGWNYIELFYRNQGEERSGYVTDEFMTAIAKKAGVKDLAKWNKARRSKAVLSEVHKTTAEAESLEFAERRRLRSKARPQRPRSPRFPRIQRRNRSRDRPGGGLSGSVALAGFRAWVYITTIIVRWRWCLSLNL